MGDTQKETTGGTGSWVGMGRGWSPLSLDHRLPIFGQARRCAPRAHTADRGHVFGQACA